MLKTLKKSQRMFQRMRYAYIVERKKRNPYAAWKAREALETEEDDKQLRFGG